VNEITEEEKVVMSEIGVEIEVISKTEHRFRTPGDRNTFSKYWNEMA